MLLVRTLINFWSSFYKNDTVRFQEIPISLSCCLSEIDHLAWMTCLSTSTRDGRWRPKTRFYSLNIGSQSPWDNFFSNCKKEYPRDLVFFFGLLLSRTVRRIVFHRHFFSKRCRRNGAHALSNETSAYTGKKKKKKEHWNIRMTATFEIVFEQLLSTSPQQPSS